METCVKQNCPFIYVCNNYSLCADRSNCPTKDRILRAAKRYEQQLDEAEKKRRGK